MLLNQHVARSALQFSPHSTLSAAQPNALVQTPWALPQSSSKKDMSITQKPQSNVYKNILITKVLKQVAETGADVRRNGTNR